MTKMRYCGVCGWARKHRQLVVGGVLVYQCTFCHADKPIEEVAA